MKKQIIMSLMTVALVNTASYSLADKQAKKEKTKTEQTSQIADKAQNDKTDPTKEVTMTNEITTDSGLKYVELKEGTGESPKVGQQVTVHYVGTLENGDQFDSSVDRGKPFSFTIGIGQVIKGWDEGVLTMKTGGKRKLIIPAELGYGADGAGPIPPNSTLIFEVELIEVQA